MKACGKCNFSFPGFELASVVKTFAFLDLFRFLLLHLPMLMVFQASLSLHPVHPVGTKNPKGYNYVLYGGGGRTNLSRGEQEMLAKVEKTCGAVYRNEFPEIWESAEPALRKGVWLISGAIILPIFTAVTFLLFHKKHKLASGAAMVHLANEIITIIMGMFGGWYFTDARLCFLAAFDPTYNVQALMWSGVISCAIFYKFGVVYTIYLYVNNFCKPSGTDEEGVRKTPSKELKFYLEKLRLAGVTPKVHIELPTEANKGHMEEFVKAQIKRALHDVKIQVEELNNKEGNVSINLPESDQRESLRSDHHRKSHSHHHSHEEKHERAAPSMLKLARMMSKKPSSEYQLLRRHSRGGSITGEEDSRDDVEIILPEPESRNEPD